MNLENDLTKIIFIIPYYGKFPSYFKMWLVSVAYNPTVDFLLVTDIPIEQDLPDNVICLNWSWERLIKEIQKPFDFKINIKSPYNLCDFKPAYGLIFQKYLTGYEFWGNCDIDQVFGDIRKFITEEILRSNDVIGSLGHFTLYHNSPKINELFKLHGSLFDYKTVFSTDGWYAFDEITGIKRIVLENNITHYYNMNFVADVMTAHSQMKIGFNDYKYQVFYWEKGKVFRSYIEDGEVRQEEFMYIHFQKKNPISVNDRWKDYAAFYIFSDFFYVFI